MNDKQRAQVPKSTSHTAVPTNTPRGQGDQELLSLFDHAPLPMWVFDRETLQFLAVNHAAIRHYYYTRDEFLAMTIADIRPRVDIPALRAKLAQTQEGITFAGAWLHCTKQGDILVVELTTNDLTYQGRPARMVVVNDVTERNQLDAETTASVQRERQQVLQQLELERNRLDAVVQQMPVGVVIAEAPSGKLVMGNQQVEKILRLPFMPAASMKDYTFYKGYHGDGRPYLSHEWPLSRAIRHGEVVQAEVIAMERGEWYARYDRNQCCTDPGRQRDNCGGRNEFSGYYGAPAIRAGSAGKRRTTTPSYGCRSNGYVGLEHCHGRGDMVCPA